MSQKQHSMTDWDAGQDLIACADLLAEKESDLRKAGRSGVANVLRECRFIIGEAFNQDHAHKSHQFGLPAGAREEG